MDNSIVHSITITYPAATAPTAEAVTNPGPISCAVAGTLTAPAATYTNGLTGRCLISGSFVGTVGAHPGSCGGTITVSYADATDACGNTVTAPADVIITVDPASAPAFTGTLPAAMSVQCVADVPAVSDLNYTNGETGDCEIAGMITSTQGALTGGACGGTITETWTISSATNCGRGDVVHTRVITVNDDMMPMITCPMNATIMTSGNGTGDCSAEASITVPTPTDNCGIDATTYMVDIKDPSGASIAGYPQLATAGGTITETLAKMPTCTDDTYTVSYTVDDNCGNTGTCSYTITVADDEKPVVVLQIKL